LIRDAAVVVGGHIHLPSPRLAEVVVDEDVHGFAGSPVGTGQRYSFSRKVVGLVAGDGGRRRIGIPFRARDLGELGARQEE
jgi:hypothetical protein